MKHFNLFFAIPVLFMFNIFFQVHSIQETYNLMHGIFIQIYLLGSKLKNKNNLSSNSLKIKKMKLEKVTRRYLNQFSNVQNTIENNAKQFITNQEKEIKNYGAIYLSDDGSKYQLTNDKNFNHGKKVVELNFQKTVSEKG